MLLTLLKWLESKLLNLCVSFKYCNFSIFVEGTEVGLRKERGLGDLDLEVKTDLKLTDIEEVDQENDGEVALDPKSVAEGIGIVDHIVENAKGIIEGMRYL